MTSYGNLVKWIGVSTNYWYTVLILKILESFTQDPKDLQINKGELSVIFDSRN